MMHRRLIRLAFGLAALGMAAAALQGCSDRRYGTAPQPAAPLPAPVLKAERERLWI